MRAESSSAIVSTIVEFIRDSSGLLLRGTQAELIGVVQKTDTKAIKIDPFTVGEVLQRRDESGEKFLQINFQAGQKILLTDAFVGFKPAQLDGLDMSKLPKVVTTPDLMSVFEAIEDSMASEAEPSEVELLRKIYFAILLGGEAVGFDLIKERAWVTFLAGRKASA